MQRHRDGLVLDGQGLSPFVLGLAKLLPASSRTDGDSLWVKQTRTVHTATAAAYGVITTITPDDRATQLEAGRLLQRIHLTATSQGIGLQHMLLLPVVVVAAAAAHTPFACAYCPCSR